VLGISSNHTYDTCFATPPHMSDFGISCVYLAFRFGVKIGNVRVLMKKMTQFDQWALALVACSQLPETGTYSY